MEVIVSSKVSLSFSHKSHMKSEAAPLLHSIGYTRWTLFRPPTPPPPPPNNIHCFLALKKGHPLHSILDVGGQIFGLKTGSSRLIKMTLHPAKSVNFVPTQVKNDFAVKKSLTEAITHLSNKHWVAKTALHACLKLFFMIINARNSQFQCAVQAHFMNGEWKSVKRVQKKLIHSILLQASAQ